MPKRKAEGPAAVNGKSKKRALSDEEARSNFRKGLFDTKVLEDYQQQYAESQPYKHAVIQNLVDTKLLRNVRDEIRQHISFTPKETDIYKIHQSGDLANLDGLDDSSLAKLPSLLQLRDALYSSAFRKYIAGIAGSGPLSGVKTDLAINVYTPGCHLLCHDDVIGSRRVSYILYLLDPDRAWRPAWGGALRLFPTEDLQTDAGDDVKVPRPDHTVVIPPAFNQLAFFTVQPGESFHDVEEVYKRALGEAGEEVDGGRVRMAVSGWFHIPQEGEEGYEEGLEEKLAERSSLQQLESGAKAAQFDQPQQKWFEYPVEEKQEEKEEEKSEKKGKGKGKAEEEEEDDEDEEEQAPLTEQEFEFLLKFMTPTYLAPDTVEDLNSMFADESSLRLANFLSKSFSARLRAFLEDQDRISPAAMPAPASRAQNTGVARPPHKHRFLYRYPASRDDDDDAAVAHKELSPYDELLDVFFPSVAFKKWLALATGLTLTKASMLARRFRRGMDYTLATSYDDEQPQLEVTLGITPSKGWGDDDEEEEEDEGEASEKKDKKKKGKENGEKTNGTAKSDEPSPAAEDDPPGGYEMYMAADEDDDEDNDDAGSDDGVEVAPGSKNKSGGSTMTGAGKRRKADPAVYRASGGDDDDGVLFSMPAGWNTMGVVLRDTGVLRFVKYVSQAAKGDRWDVCADFGVEFDEDDDDEEGEGDAMEE
ncbi:2-oxoglutarate and fe dioxygenase domain containing protein 1 [Diplodia corticola]|uniref:uS12 prolyl 3,4-dihydroxylase n=1 Tax=Diplodia corticola TaxID=236234 RepID=A0A1J9RMF9_9PEZI|nr:2-oxoglutarate and fe dioxygenase domain containing protein 1 [Diplodia corticola]OJD33763.1 2-oxoglutarate and fe dioxygenase domain containing protein 1 [Diplodia corticola]